MRPELIVAGKEFRDHLTSKRFLAIFTILMLLAIFGMATGMDQYNKNLEDYKKNQAENQQQQWFKDQVAALQKQIADAQANGLSAEEIASLQQQLDWMINPPMPSVLTVFGSLIQGSMTLVLMLLSVALGFDLITREREEGSLKSLLSHPVYRDSVINGKLIGAMVILFVVMGSVFLVTLAIMLFYGVVPTGDDLLRVAAFFLMALLYCAVFFALATLFSTVAKTSAMSILCVLSLAVAFIIIPSFAPTIASVIVGEPPEFTPIPLAEGDSAVIRAGAANDTADVGVVEPLPTKLVPGDDYQKYWQNYQMVTDVISTVSPMYSFGQKISPAIIYKQSGSTGPILYYGSISKPYYMNSDPTLLDSLATVWTSILAMLVELILPLAISYVMFMRSDIR